MSQNNNVGWKQVNFYEAMQHTINTGKRVMLEQETMLSDNIHFAKWHDDIDVQSVCWCDEQTNKPDPAKVLRMVKSNIRGRWYVEVS